ncbi:MAG TPA: UDP-N-acetylmuramoyl-L-alanine--D-glutamate ligase [Gemmatimonadaceae bacterium]|nr:UDP-N-acetylmuramoyl-L-alanine--D-glutamate ligase [Gemmatimonadaceae bacterium]
MAARSRRTSDPALPAGWLNGEVAVVGLARSGRAVATLLARTGADVYASDSGDSGALHGTAVALRREGVDVALGGHDLARIARASLVVTSPGVPPDAPPLARAIGNGVEVVSEVEIALRLMPDLRYVAVTGTNGKTTTTALVATLFSALGHRATAAGNIGTPLAELALEPVAPDWVALEISSFQLHDTPSIAPCVGVLTNLSANHLDRYASVDEYFGDKALLFRNATAASQWVTNADDPAVEALAAGAAGLHCRFSTRGDADACYDRGRGLLEVFGEPLLARADLALMGDHNVANALAASLAVMLASEAHRTPAALGTIARALRAFHALEHRIEIVGEQEGVLWINDSKSTNVASTAVALRGMTRPTVLLLGGKHKGEPYTTLAGELRRTCTLVIAYGEAAPLIEQDLRGVIPVQRLGSSFQTVVDAARAAARPGQAVLLSPACSSYDMFDNYEQRGREFKRLALEGARGSTAASRENTTRGAEPDGGPHAAHVARER